MSEPEEIAARCEEVLARAQSLAGKRVLVSAGGTREPLDAVRFLGNRSSGRMGVELAAEAQRRGADVTLVAANLAVAAPAGVAIVEARHGRRDRARNPRGRRSSRRARHGGRDRRLPAIRSACGRSARRTAMRGPSSSSRRETSSSPLRTRFHATARCASRSARSRARRDSPGSERCSRRKSVDLVVFNDVSRGDIGFDSADNEVVLITAAGERTVPKAAKRVVARAVLDEVERLLRDR